MEIWVRVEGSGSKFWTSTKQPFLPYLFAHGNENIAETYYDARGIRWVKDQAIAEVKKNPKLLVALEQDIFTSFKILQTTFQKKEAISHAELITFLHTAEKYWGQFEFAWWIWEMMYEKEGYIEINKTFMELRATTQDFVAEADSIIRKSLEKLYPALGKHAHLLLVAEIESGKLPSSDELLARAQGYFFIQNTLEANASFEDIEKKYHISIEKPVRTNATEEKITKIKGQTAQPGTAKGPVKIIMSVRQIEKMNAGDILVSPMTMPDIIPAMKKAAAIITDEGGMLSHAAIISRELGIPCIIGTKIATQVLKDGDTIEVDATKGIITRC